MDLNPEDEFDAADLDGDGILTKEEFKGWAAQKQEIMRQVHEDKKALVSANILLKKEVEGDEKTREIDKKLQVITHYRKACGDCAAFN